MKTRFTSPLKALLTAHAITNHGSQRRDLIIRGSFQTYKRQLSLTVAIVLISISLSLPTMAADNQFDLETEILNATAPLSIELDADILLSKTLTIPVGKDITLTGGSRLIGTNGQATITVNGKLTLNGITVTHNSGETGRGITVNAGGELILESGQISGNITTGLRNANGGGSGVCVNGTGGTAMFIMNGGIISGNTTPCNDANHNGGGGVQVFSNNGNATFMMNAGTISGNAATTSGSNGGGVFVSGNSAGHTAFIMNGGIISNNESSNGGGVFNFSGSSEIHDGAQITGNHAITKDGGGIYNQTGAAGSRGSFIMYGGQITGNEAAETGGGVRNNNADFEMRGGEISGNTSIGKVGGNGGGGGLMNMNGGTFTLVDGKIIGNTSILVVGGGVHNKTSNAFISTFNMINGEISGNTAPSGAGVMNWSDKTDPGVFNMEGGTISANITTDDDSKGGGVYNYGPATFVMRDGEITNHTTVNNGGGVHNTNGAVVAINNGTISGNQVSEDGGGIWTDDLTNLTVGANAIFSNNRASAAYNRNPADDDLYAEQILGTNWTSPLIQGYNNYDINYRYGTPITYTVTYDGNGNTGGNVPTDINNYEPNDIVTVMGQGDLVRTDHTFLGWSTSQTVAPAQYQEGDTFTITSNITFYALWNKNNVGVPNNNTSNSNRIIGTPRSPNYPDWEPNIDILETPKPIEETPLPSHNPRTGHNDYEVPIYLAGICILLSGLLIKFTKNKS